MDNIAAEDPEDNKPVDVQELNCLEAVIGNGPYLDHDQEAVDKNQDLEVVEHTDYLQVDKVGVGQVVGVPVYDEIADYENGRYYRGYCFSYVEPEFEVELHNLVAPANEALIVTLDVELEETLYEVQIVNHAQHLAIFAEHDYSQVDEIVVLAVDFVFSHFGGYFDTRCLFLCEESKNAEVVCFGVVHVVNQAQKNYQVVTSFLDYIYVVDFVVNWVNDYQGLVVD